MKGRVIRRQQKFHPFTIIEHFGFVGAGTRNAIAIFVDRFGFAFLLHVFFKLTQNFPTTLVNPIYFLNFLFKSSQLSVLVSHIEPDLQNLRFRKLFVLAVNPALVISTVHNH